MIITAVSLCAVVAVSGCATREASKSESAVSLADTSRSDARYSSEQHGKKAYAWGDKYTAANLFLQAYKADNTVMNRFNLATAYASIGRIGEASDMYASLVPDGRYTWLTEDSLNGDPSRTMAFNVGVESAKRLAVLDAMPQPTGSIGDEVGTGHTNEEARVLDQNAEDARGIER